MEDLRKGSCDDCSGRWDRLDFWQSDLTSAEITQEEWGDVHCRKFNDIATSEQCVFCQLILNGLLRARDDYRIQSEDVIYFAKYLYFDTSTPQAGSCADYPLEIQAPYNRRICVIFSMF
jgi:hypothetical protein